jgi:hypothetical protein
VLTSLPPSLPDQRGSTHTPAATHAHPLSLSKALRVLIPVTAPLLAILGAPDLMAHPSGGARRAPQVCAGHLLTPATTLAPTLTASVFLLSSAR